MATPSLNDELASIRELMEDTRFASVENGRYLMVWGIALSLGVGYSELQNAWEIALSPWIVWGALLASAWAYTILARRREQREARVRSVAGRWLASEWMSCGMSMTVAFVGGGLLGAVPSDAVAGLAATFLAIPVMATGRLARVRWLTCVGALWWVAALVLFAIPPESMGMVLLACLLALFVLPGAVLNVRGGKVPSRML